VLAQVTTELKLCAMRRIGITIRNVIGILFRRGRQLRVAWLKTLFMSALAGPKDYEMCGLALRGPALEVAAYIGSQRTASKAEQLGQECNLMDIPHGCRWHVDMRDRFCKGEHIGGEVIQLTVTTAYEVLQRRPVQWEVDLMNANKGHMEWSVAAMLLGLNSLDLTLMRYMIEQRMHLVPLREWKVCFGQWLQSLKRVGSIRGSAVDRKAVLQLRKVFNCCERNLDEADWDAEYHNRVNDVPVQSGINGAGMMDKDVWTNLVAKYCDELATLVVHDMVAGPTLMTMGDWFQSRWAHAPSGSTTLRGLMAEVKTKDEELSAQARPGKKCAWEALPDWFAEYCLHMLMPGATVHCSTKNEPGGKNRALFAVDDINTIVASFASVHMEKFMNVWGIKAKQAPADVVEWIRVAEYMAGDEMWLSLDYSDYNHEHMLRSLVQWNISLAKQWQKMAGIEKVYEEKAVAALWVAMAHMHTYATDPTGREYRMYGTLCSGHRDTARDNSALHGVYSKAISEMMQQFDSKCNPLETFFTGDDEDAVHCDVVAAAHYLVGHKLVGFNINVAKQSAGLDTHEFLQRDASDGNLPVRPMFAALAQLASGNWYTDVHIWYDSVVQSVSDNIMELCSRGMPIPWGRRLAASVINATMRKPMVEGGYRELEWWEFRHGTSIHPLWYGLAGRSKPNPVIDSKVLPVEGAPSRATDAWLASRERMCGVIFNADARDKLRMDCMRESYSTLYKKQRAKQQSRFAETIWPERRSRIPYEQFNEVHYCQADAAAVAAWLRSGESDRRPATMDEVLSRFGLDARLVEAAGGLNKVLANMAPSMMSKYETPQLPRLLPLECAALDSAVRSWLSMAHAVPMPFQQNRDWRSMRRYANGLMKDAMVMDKGGSAPSVIDVYYAPNAAGKSTFTGLVIGVADMDEVMRNTGLHSDVGRYAGKELPETLRVELRYEVQRYIVRGGFSGVCTQYPPDAWLPKAVDREFRVQLWIVDIDDEVRAARMRARAWTEERIQRRLARWHVAVDDIMSGRSQVLTEAELLNARVVDTFDSIVAYKQLEDDSQLQADAAEVLERHVDKGGSHAAWDKLRYKGTIHRHKRSEHSDSSAYGMSTRVSRL
jgi:hypothetical protein